MDFFSVLSHLDWSQVGQLTLQHLLLVRSPWAWRSSSACRWAC